jgi:hypothetical protein
MTRDEIMAEIAKLEIDIASVPEADRPIVQEEIERLRKEMTALPDETGIVTKEETALMSEEDIELMKEARDLTGEGARGRFPTAKRLKIDSVKVKKVIDGEELIGKPLQRFVHNFKVNEEWQTEDWGPELNGVIIKVRRFIREKWEDGQKTRYQSFEYNNKNDLVRVYTGTPKAPEIVFVGTEDQCVEHFATGEMNSVGKPKVSFDKFANIYMLIGEEVVKFETKVSVRDHALWPYLFSFGENESHLAFKTKVTLNWVEYNDQAKAWVPQLVRSERVDLKESLKVAKELNKFFDFIDGKRGSPTPVEGQAILDDPGPDDYSQPEADDVKLADIPF